MSYNVKKISLKETFAVSLSFTFSMGAFLNEGLKAKNSWDTL